MRTLFLLMLMGLFAAGCGFDSSKKESDKSDEPTENDDPISAMQKAVKDATGGGGGETVDHRSLRDLLKENMRGGFERTSYSSQKSGAMGFNVSTAEAEYDGGGGRKIRVSIVDTGGMGMALMGMAAWSSVEIDQENSDGWERTSTFQGYKSFEKYNKSSQNTELAVIIENRFIVNFEGSNCDMEDLKDFAEAIDMDDLKKLI